MDKIFIGARIIASKTDGNGKHGQDSGTIIDYDPRLSRPWLIEFDSLDGHDNSQRPMCVLSRRGWWIREIDILNNTVPDNNFENAKDEYEAILGYPDTIKQITGEKNG